MGFGLFCILPGDPPRQLTPLIKLRVCLSELETDCFPLRALSTLCLHPPYSIRTATIRESSEPDLNMADKVSETMHNVENIAVDDMRELEEDTQNELLERVWPFPLRYSDCNTTGIECAVLVLRRMLRDMPADSHCRAIIFGEMDQTVYKVEKEQLDQTRALFRYAWHHLPDLDGQRENRLLRLEVMDRQRPLLDILLVDRHMAQSQVSFEALMESEAMLAAFWGRPELQPFRGVVAWQAKGEKEWQARQRSANSRPVIWKLEQGKGPEDSINKRLGLREVSGGNTTMLLPNWPRCLRVKMTSPVPVSMDRVLEQKVLSLKGYELLAKDANDDKYRVSETGREYTLIASVVLRSSGEHNDVVYTFDKEGSEITSSLLTPVPYHTLLDTQLVNEAMLYFSRVDVENSKPAVTISSDSESGDGLQGFEDKKFRERLKALDPGARTGLTPLSSEAEQKLPRDIVPGLKAAKAKFFQQTFR